jgi:hypothetical protein
MMMIMKVSCGVNPRQKNSTSLFLSWMSYKATKGFTAFTSKMDSDQMAMGLPPVWAAVFLIAK